MPCPSCASECWADDPEGGPAFCESCGYTGDPSDAEAEGVSIADVDALTSENRRLREALETVARDMLAVSMLADRGSKAERARRAALACERAAKVAREALGGES